MYSPKISEDLIPVLYKISKAIHKPMTFTVNYMLEKVIDQLNGETLFPSLAEEERAIQQVAEQVAEYFKSSKKEQRKKVLKLLKQI